MKKLLSRPELIPAVLFLLTFVVAAIKNRYFLDFAYLLDTTSLFAEGALLVIGMTYVIICGQIDLSVGSMVALIACVFAKVVSAGCPVPFAIIVAIAAGLSFGAINGILVAYVRLPSFLVTLSTMALYRGAAQAMLASKSEPVAKSFIGIDHQVVAGVHIPLPLAIVIVFVTIFGLLLHRTNIGKRVFAVGTNEVASLYSGVRTARTKMMVFMLSGGLAAIAALLIDSRLGVARFDHAKGLELDVITATVLGGVSITGGKGTLGGAMIAFALVGIVRTALGLANANAEIQLTILGALLIVAVSLNRLMENRMAKS